MKAEEDDKLLDDMADAISDALPTLDACVNSASLARAALSAIRAAGYCVMPEEPSDDVANACDCIEAHLQTAHEGFAVIIEEEFRPQLQTVVRAARERVERIGAEEK